MTTIKLQTEMSAIGKRQRKGFSPWHFFSFLSAVTKQSADAVAALHEQRFSPTLVRMDVAQLKSLSYIGQTMVGIELPRRLVCHIL